MEKEKDNANDNEIEHPTQEKKDTIINLNENFDWDFIFDREWLRTKK